MGMSEFLSMHLRIALPNLDDCYDRERKLSAV